MKKINVCHVVSGLKSGGAESMIYTYCNHLNLDQYNMHILYQHDPTEKNINEFKKIKFSLKRITSKKKNPLKNFWETYKYIKDNNVNIIHCHMNLANFIPLIAARICNIETRICHSHTAARNENKILKKLAVKILKFLCVTNSTHLVACGYEAGKYMYGDNKYIILNNAIDIKKFSYNKNIRLSKRKELQIKDDQIVIGHIGRFVNVKNHIFIINLFEKLVNNNDKYKLTLIGSGELEEEIKQLINEKGLEEKVIFTGIIENTSDYYNVFDVFILPSLWEGLPIVSLEAQASGLPCFFSENIDNNSVIIENLVTMIELDLNKWFEKIYNINFNSRNENYEDYFIKKNYEISRESIKLDKLYKEHYK